MRKNSAPSKPRREKTSCSGHPILARPQAPPSARRRGHPEAGPRGRPRARRFSRQMGQREGSLEALTQAARINPDERLRDEAIAAMALPDLRRGPSWQALPAGAQSIACDGLYRLYARADAQGVISI